jgi:hypothetical protein
MLRKGSVPQTPARTGVCSTRGRTSFAFYIIFWLVLGWLGREGVGSVDECRWRFVVE